MCHPCTLIASAIFTRQLPSQALKAAFTVLMTASQEVVTAAVRALVERLRAVPAGDLSEHEALALRLNDQFPDDVGLMSAFFLNLVSSRPRVASGDLNGAAAHSTVGIWHPRLCRLTSSSSSPPRTEE